MSSYASVIIDISAKGIDRPFEYEIPDALAGRAKVGSTVVIPFGKTSRLGYVIDVLAEPSRSKHQTITAVLDEPLAFDETMAELAIWTAEKYVCSVSDVLRLMLPPGRSRRLRQENPTSDGAPRYSISQPQVNTKKERYAKLMVSADAARQAALELSRAPRQAAALRALADDGPLPAHRIAAFAGASSATLRALAGKGLVALYMEDTYREPDFTYPEELPLDLQLTAEQRQALTSITESNTSTSPFLLQGVTGSGKTEVYLRAIEQVLERGQTAIALVPEIALTPQTVSRFRTRFGERVAVLHSGLGLGERYDQWRRIQDGSYSVVVGARSAVWAPVDNLGLIVIDEEHEPSYKQDRTPRYHARDVAIKRAELSGAGVILGSATPSVESRYRADKKDYHLVRLTKRIEDRPMPAVEIVDMKSAERVGESGFFSTRLLDQLSETIRRGDKAILFLNRRGFANFIICRDCGHVINCVRCNVSLTYHSRERTLLCHHCGFTEPAPSLCPECGGRSIGFFGAGTERVESELKELFPETPVTRMDSDTTTAKDAHRTKLGSFRAQAGGILLGTQMIAKGLDFPDVTFVGIINADTALNLPDFRAGERTFQLMMQVGGRAGRGTSPGSVIVQTYNPDNYAIQALLTGDYDTFYEHEVTLRDALDYPPFSELINIGVSASDEDAAVSLVNRAAEMVRDKMEAGLLPGVKELLGPAPAPLSRLKNRYRWHLLLKTDGDAATKRFLRDAYSGLVPREVRDAPALTYDVDPMSLL